MESSASEVNNSDSSTESPHSPIILRQKHRYKGQRKHHHIKVYKSPSETARAMLVAGISKTKYPPLRILYLAFLAGIITAMASHLCLMTAGMFIVPPPAHPGAEPPDHFYILYIPQIRRLFLGLFLPASLCGIMLFGGELYTGNSVTIMIAMVSRSVPISKGLYNLGGVLIGNYAGCVSYAFFISKSSGLFDDKAYADVVQYLLESKTMHLTFLQAFLRGIGGNAWICAAVFFSTCAEDVPGKIMGIYVAVFSMGASGFEHIIMNMYLLTLGVMVESGHEVTYFDVWFRNYLPVFIGNSVVGWAFGVSVYFLYLHDYVIPKVENPAIPKEKGIPLPRIGKDEFSFMKRCFSKCKRTPPV